MKIKAALLALFVAGLAVSVALVGNVSFAAKKKPKFVAMCHLNASKRPVTVLVRRTQVRLFLRRGYKRGACPKPRTVTRFRTVTQPASTVTVTVTAPPPTTTTTSSTSSSSSSSSSSTTTTTTTTGTTSTSTTTSTTTT